MASAHSLSLLGVVVFAALCLANPIERNQQVAEVTLQPFDDILEDEFILKQQHDADEITPDHDEPMPNAWDDHSENIDRILGDAEEVVNEEETEAIPSESWHGVVKRSVDEEEEEYDEEAEDDTSAKEGSDGNDEHEVEKRELSEGLLEWYRAAIETNST